MLPANKFKSFLASSQNLKRVLDDQKILGLETGGQSLETIQLSTMALPTHSGQLLPYTNPKYSSSMTLLHGSWTTQRTHSLDGT